MICPICTRWFCTDPKCLKLIKLRAHEPGDRTAYFANYYAEHREQRLAYLTRYQRENQTWKKRDRRDYFRERYRNMTRTTSGKTPVSPVDLSTK